MKSDPRKKNSACRMNPFLNFNKVVEELRSAFIIPVLVLVALGWGLAGSASAAIINEPMTGATAPGWVIGGSAYLTASTGVDPVGDGWLRITDLGGNEAGYGYLNSSFDISQGAVIQFDYATWGGAGDGGFGCGTTGADGYSVYLFDGSQSFSVGASGGSLGYDKKTVAPVNPGLAYGYIGTGIDEWGNFSNPTEGRTGGPGGRCNAVAVRGPYNHPSGAYYYLGGTASNIAQLAFPGQVYRPGQIGPQYRKVVIYLTPQLAPNYLRMDVYLQVGYNQPLTQVLNGLMVGRPVPATVKIGYAASTGGSNNYHEIRNLVVDPLPSSDIDLAIAKIASSPTVTQGGPVTYTVTVRNNGPSNVTANNVPIVDTVPGQITGVNWTCAGSGAACGAASGSGNNINTTVTLPLNSYATYTITGTVSASTPLGTQITNTAALTVPGGINDYNSSNNSASATVSVTGPQVSISGMAYSDSGAGGGTAHNGVRDGAEGSTAQTMYAKLFLAGNLTTALQTYTIGAAGTYTFNNVPSYDDYTIIISNVNDTNFNPAPPNGNWVYTSPANYTLNVSVAGSNLTNQNFGLWIGSRISGKVINDNGLNGSPGNANDGILNAAETGISGVTVQLKNNANTTTYDTATTDSGGNFALFTNTASATLRIYETNLAGYLSVSYNAGTTGGAYTIANDYISFAYTLYTDYTGIIFGDVQNNIFTPTSQSKNGSALAPVYYAHTFTPGSGGSVSFAVNSRTQGAWPAVAYYLDTNCNGTYDLGVDTLISGALTASAGVPICILVQENVASSATNGTTDALVTQATFTYTNSVGPVVQTYNVTDTTTVVASNLSTSTKTWTDLTNGGGDQNPLDVIQYTITLIETAGVAASGVTVVDTLPATLNSLSVVSFPAGATNSSTATQLNITGVSVPANGSATIVFNVTIAGGTAVGTTINNTATITNPAGLGATPSAPAITVSASAVAATGNKALYFYGTAGGAPGPISRSTIGNTTNVTIGNPAVVSWIQDIPMQLPMTLNPTTGGNVAVNLWLSNTTDARTRTVTVTLSCGAISLTQTPSITLNIAPSLITFNFPYVGNQTCASGNSWVFTLNNNNFNRVLTAYPVNGSPSYINLPSLNVINVNSVTAYNTPYPGIGTLASWTTGTVYLRAVVSDPFGNADITGATSTIKNPAGATIVPPSGPPPAMTEQPPARTASTKTFEYAFLPTAPAASGFWTAAVAAQEGLATETPVPPSDTRVGTFKIVPSLSVLKSAQTYSDPVNGSTNPKAIPGAVMLYTVQVTNNSYGSVDANTTVITDPIPANTMMCVSTLCSNPVMGFICSPAPVCGLTGALLKYSNDGGLSYGYPPVADSNGYDSNVTNIQITTSGPLNGASSPQSTNFSVTFKVKIK
jgi:uncharacterized repeat protein (TIGR01451 family)